jgi:hypothetical protein
MSEYCSWYVSTAERDIAEDGDTTGLVLPQHATGGKQSARSEDDAREL